MTDETKCRDIQAELPLLFIGDLRPAEEKVVKDHLKACSSCREIYQKELALFEKAAQSHPVELSAHPTADLLENWVSDRAGMNSDDRVKVEAHLAGCKLCREAVQKTAALPDRLEDLVPDGSLEVTERVSEGATKVTPPPQPRATTSVRRWRTTAVWVAAAAVLILAVTQLIYKSPEPAAVIEGHFSSVMRSTAEPMLFESSAADIDFRASVYIGSEQNHTYRLRVVDGITDSILFTQESVTRFDSLGSAHFQVRLSPGEYYLLVQDILETDTISIEHPFEIRLK